MSLGRTPKRSWQAALNERGLAKAYENLGQSNWYGHPPYRLVHGSYPGDFGEEVLLGQKLVSGPGVAP